MGKFFGNVHNCKKFQDSEFVKSIIFDVTLLLLHIYIRTYIFKCLYDIYRISINHCCS